MKKNLLFTKSVLTILLFIIVCESAFSQHQVSTTAGSSQGYQDGTTTSARFSAPTDACISPDGQSIYIADYSGNRIRKINRSTNQVTTLAGNGTMGSTDGVGTSAKFSYPSGLAISSNGQILYIADNGNSLIRKLDLSNNSVTTIAGDGNFSHSDNTNALQASFNQPTDLALRGDTVLFISDTENHVIRKFNLVTNAVTTVVGYVGVGGFLDGIGTSAAVKNPAGLAISQDGSMLYLADNGNNMIRKIEISNYNTMVIAGSGSPAYSDNANGLLASFYAPQGVAVDPLTDALYVTDTYNHRIRKVDLMTSQVSTIAGDGSVPPASVFANNMNGLLAKFFYPTNCIVSPNGESIYVTDQGNYKVREVKTDNTSNNIPPITTSDFTSTNNDLAVSINVLSNDSDSDGTLNVSTVDINQTSAGIQNTLNNSYGAFSVDASGTVTYVPSLSFYGQAVLTYTVTDNDGAVSNIGTLTIDVNAIPQANNDIVTTSLNTVVTFNVITNDMDADGTISSSTVDLDQTLAGIQNSKVIPEGVLMVNSAGEVTYTPTTGYLGSFNFEYTVNDNDLASSSPGVVSMTVANNVSLYSENKITFKMYPNPSSDYLIIDTDKSITDNLVITNQLGAVVTVPVLCQETNRIVLNTIQLPSGIYYINNQHLFIKK